MSEMDGSAVNAIAELALKTVRADALQIEGYPHETMVVGPDGAAEWREKPPADILHRVDSVYDLVRLIAAEGHQGSLWVSPVRLDYVDDPVFRHDHVLCVLAKTEQYEKLLWLAADMRWQNQKDVIWMLQTCFDECVASDVVKALRFIKFSKTDHGQVAITHGGDSLGRQVAAECKGGDGDIPEYVFCDVPLFSTPGYTLQQPCRIKCRLLIDTDNQRLCLTPVAGELDKAERSVLAALVHELSVSGDPGNENALVQCPVYLGTPG